MSDIIPALSEGMQRLRLRAPLLALGLLAGAGTAAAQSDTTPQSTLENLQQQIDELTSRLDKSAAIGSTRSSMKLAGRLHIDNWTHSTSDPGIDELEGGDAQNRTLFRRARLGASGKIHDSMGYKLEIDFGLPSKLGFKDMYVSFQDLPAGQSLVIGNQKRPYGLTYMNSSRYTIFMERAMAVEALNQSGRRLGIQAKGASENLDWNWRYGAFHLENIGGSGRISGDTFQPEFAGRLARTLKYENDGRDYAHFGVAGTLAFPDGNPNVGEGDNSARFRTRPEGRTDGRWIDTSTIGGTDAYQVAALEGVWNSGPTQVLAEYLNTWVTRDDTNDVQFTGGHIQIAHFLTGEYMPWNRKSGTIGRVKPSSNFSPSGGWGGWQIAARYSFADFSNEDVRGGRGEALTLGINWYMNPSTNVQLNYIRGDISERTVTDGGGDYEILGLRMRVDF